MGPLFGKRQPVATVLAGATMAIWSKQVIYRVSTPAVGFAPAAYRLRDCTSKKLGNTLKSVL